MDEVLEKPKTAGRKRSDICASHEGKSPGTVFFYVIKGIVKGEYSKLKSLDPRIEEVRYFCPKDQNHHELLGVLIRFTRSIQVLENLPNSTYGCVENSSFKTLINIAEGDFLLFTLMKNGTFNLCNIPLSRIPVFERNLVNHFNEISKNDAASLITNNKVVAKSANKPEISGNNESNGALELTFNDQVIHIDGNEIELSYLEIERLFYSVMGMSDVQIAIQTDVPLGTSKNRGYNARKKFDGLDELVIFKKLCEMGAINLDLFKLKAREFLGEGDLTELSKLDREILGEIVLGKTYGEIAHLRNRSEKTIKNNVNSILKKCNCHNRRELVARAILEE